MIDVSGSGSHSLDQREYQERSRYYQQKVQQLTPAYQRSNNSLMCDVPISEKQLNIPFISQEDMDLVIIYSFSIMLQYHKICYELRIEILI